MSPHVFWRESVAHTTADSWKSVELLETCANTAIRVSHFNHFLFAICLRVAILIQRTSRSLIIEDFRGSTGSDFDRSHKQELDYWVVNG